MKKAVLGGVATFFLIVFISACSSTFTIISDYDKQADFSAYKTYNYAPGADSLMGPGSLKTKMFIEEYMSLLGYELSESPHLYLAVNGKVQQKTGVQSNNYGGYYGYYGWDNYATTYTYNQTTIVIDLIDVEKRQLVWQGAATGEFDQYSMKDKKRQQMIDQIFGQYPYQAGSSAPRAYVYGKYYKKPVAK